MKWQVLDTGLASAKKNMALDYELLRGLSSRKRPILHFYDWEENAATYGHFLDPYTLLNKEAVQKHRLQLARRPTGGGLVFHLTDFAYSMLIPATHSAYSVNTLENYAFVNRITAKIIKKLLHTKKTPELLPVEPEMPGAHARHFCMAKPTKYDVMWEGRKVGGAAQRRTKYGFLHQGTICLGMPSLILLKEVLQNLEVLQAIQKNSFFLIQEELTKTQLSEGRRMLKGIFLAELLRL